MGVLRRKHRQPNSLSTPREPSLRHLSDSNLSDTPVPARVLETPGGKRWLVVLIARLASVDPIVETGGARLILKVEPLFRESERVQIVTVKAHTLEEIDGEMLREALLRRRRGSGRRTRHG
jgi:hypothetical protein